MKNWTLEKSKTTPLDQYIHFVNTEKRQTLFWKYSAIISFVCLVAALAVLMYAVNLPKAFPLVITVSDWGEAKYVGEVSNYSYNGIKVPEIAINYQLRKFIINRFSIPYDPHILRSNLKDCYSALTRESAAKLSSELKADNPMQQYGKKIVTVEIETVLKLSTQSYQVDFFIITADSRGQINERIRMRGILAIKLMEPPKEDQVLNPLGIYITNFDFTQIKEVIK